MLRCRSYGVRGAALRLLEEQQQGAPSSAPAVLASLPAGVAAALQNAGGAAELLLRWEVRAGPRLVVATPQQNCRHVP